MAVRVHVLTDGFPSVHNSGGVGSWLLVSSLFREEVNAY
jgi:hypothetical protein